MEPSAELRAKQLIEQMTRLASEVNPDLEEMLDCMVAAAKILAELPTVALSGPRRVTVNAYIAKLLELLEVFAVLVKKHLRDLQTAKAGSASGGVFKPRF